MTAQSKKLSNPGDDQGMTAACSPCHGPGDFQSPLVSPGLVPLSLSSERGPSPEYRPQRSSLTLMSEGRSQCQQPRREAIAAVTVISPLSLWSRDKSLSFLNHKLTKENKRKKGGSPHFLFGFDLIFVLAVPRKLRGTLYFSKMLGSNSSLVFPKGLPPHVLLLLPSQVQCWALGPSSEMVTVLPTLTQPHTPIPSFSSS